MARSKEQWKAQQKRAMHTQPQSNSFFQVKRPSPHPSASSALFRLGKPASAALLKPDPIQIPRQSGSSSGQVIDLTLDDDEEEDEPMGALVAEHPAAPAAVAVSTTASDSLKLSMLDGTGNEASAVAQSLLQTAEVPVPLAEDVESDVDEEWPTVPPVATPSVPSSVNPLVPSVVTAALPSLVNEQSSRGQTTDEVGTALDAIRRTIPFTQDGQHGNDSTQTAQVEGNDGQGDQHTQMPLYDDDEMEADVDEELPIQASTIAKDASGSKTADRVVRVENLEDGEIFEEGAVPKSSMQLQRAIMRERLPVQFDAQPVDAMGIRPHLRNKKQKKRGKKKAKRKLEAMQMMHGAPGEMPTEFERVIRQRPFVDAPPPGQYTLAMMRNGSRGEAMNVRPVFQDPPPAPFQHGLVSVPHPSIRPPPPQLSTPPLPPPPYEDSQILRVNRQGSMEMLGGGVELPPMFSEPPRYGGFKYRSVSMSPPSPVSAGPVHNLQLAVSSDQSHLPPLPTSSRVGPSNPVAASDSDDFDLDSLRAAALRSKTKRPPKTSTPVVQKVPQTQLSLSEPSSPKLAASEQRNSEPTIPEIDKLRLEILKSMTRNRNRGADKSPSKMLSLMTPANEGKPVEKSEQNDRAKTSDANKDNNVTRDPQVAQTGAPQNLPETSQANTSGDMLERAVNDGASCETDKSTATSEQNEGGDKMDSPSASTLESPKPSAKEIAHTPEFRPLTACSQSLVIRLNPEDFSPRKGGNDTHATSIKTNTSSSVQDAIKNLRRKIAEREKQQTNRLLENAAAKLAKQSSGPGSSSSAASSSSSPNQLSPGRDISAQPPGATAPKDISATKSCLTTEQTASKDASTPASRKSELDFDAIRAEYEQCVTECEEADMHIARLSHEMAQLEKLSVGSTVRGS